MTGPTRSSGRRPTSRHATDLIRRRPSNSSLSKKYSPLRARVSSLPSHFRVHGETTGRQRHVTHFNSNAQKSDLALDAAADELRAAHLPDQFANTRAPRARSRQDRKAAHCRRPYQTSRFNIESSVLLVLTMRLATVEESPRLSGEPKSRRILPYPETRTTGIFGSIEEQLFPRCTNNERGVVIERSDGKAAPKPLGEERQPQRLHVTLRQRPPIHCSRVSTASVVLLSRCGNKRHTTQPAQKLSTAEYTPSGSCGSGRLAGSRIDIEVTGRRPGLPRAPKVSANTIPIDD